MLRARPARSSWIGVPGIGVPGGSDAGAPGSGVPGGSDAGMPGSGVPGGSDATAAPWGGVLVITGAGEDGVAACTRAATSLAPPVTFCVGASRGSPTARRAPHPPQNREFGSVLSAATRATHPGASLTPQALRAPNSAQSYVVI